MKKISILLFILGLFFFGCFIVVYDKEDNNSITENQKKYVEILDYDYIKSHNFNKKTVVEFPIINRYNVKGYSDYFKSFIKDGNYLGAKIISNKKLDNAFDELVSYYHDNVVYSDITDKVYLKNNDVIIFKIVFKDNGIYKELISYLFQIDENEVANIYYIFDDNFLNDDDIMYIYQNIKLSNKNVYSNIYNNLLNLKYVANNELKNMYFKIDFSKYQENVNENLSSDYSLIINQNNLSKTEIVVDYISKTGEDDLFVKLIKGLYNDNVVFIKKDVINNYNVYQFNGENVYSIIDLLGDAIIIIKSNKEDINNFLNFTYD